MLKELKEQVWQANMELHRRGLITLTWGNASGLDRKKGLFAIKPSGVSYSDLKPADMVILDLDGKKVEGALKPSSDTPSHLVIYRGFAEIGGITHTHSTYATAFAQACRPIPCLGTTHADVFHGEVPLTRCLSKTEVKTAYENNTGKVIVERFKSFDPAAVPGVLVACHGPFAWGKDAADAVANGIALEEIARIALGTLQLNPAAKAIPAYILEKHYTRKHGPGAYYGQR